MPRLAPVTKATGAGADMDGVLAWDRIGVVGGAYGTTRGRLRQAEPSRRLGQRCERTVGPGEAGPTRRPPANDARASASGTTIRTASEGWGDATGGSGVRGDGSGLGHRTRDQSALRGRGSEDRGGRSAAGNGGGDG